MPIPEEDSTLRRRSVKDPVYETLCDWIVRDKMMPNERLLDTELATYFNVSRAPVREVLQILETRKLIKVTPGRATMVAGADRSGIEKCYHPLVGIQGLAVRLVAPRLTKAQLARMEEVWTGFEEACRADQAEKVIHYDSRFHEVILRAVDNEHIMEFSHILLLRVQRIKCHHFRGDMPRKTSMEHHMGILKTLCDWSADLAAELMRSRWLYVIERCLREVEVEGVQWNRNGGKDRVKQMGQKQTR